MTLRHLRIFVTLCKTANTTSAAETLFMSQPAVSLAIKELENYYGVKLFDRISKRLHITSAGEVFLRYASHIVSLFDDMEFSIRNCDALGQLRIGSSITIGTQMMPGYVKTFSDQWPDVQLKVRIDSTDAIVQKILNSELDLALIEGVANSKYLIVEDYMADELAVICSPKHPFAERGGISPNELQTEKFLLREFGSGTRDLFDHVMESHGLQIEPFWESTSTTALINAVVKNLGIAVIPLRMALAIPAEGEICILKIENVIFQRNFSIIYHKDKFLTPSALSFLEICRHSQPANDTPGVHNP